MVRIFGILAVVLTMAAGIAMSRAKGAEKVPEVKPEKTSVLKIGMLKGMFRDVPMVQVQAASIPFKRIFKEMVGEDAEIVIYPDYATLAERLRTGECSIGVFHGFEFAWVHKEHPKLDPLVVTVPVARKIESCLVVNKDEKYAKPADLEGNCVALPKSSKAHCLLFLDRLQKELPANTCGPLNCNTQTPEEVLDAVVNGEKKAAMVDTSSLVIYQNMKPGAHDQLKVITRSEPFPPAVIVARKGAVDEKVLDKLRKSLVGANNTAQGRLMLTLWSLKGIEHVPADYTEQLEKITKAYPPNSTVDATVPTSTPR